ncbi:MAG: hypothetical protein JWO80_3463 [Bryobacterales bacterium]|nr:hypothetical protein [Bryobacterales bacterium]
MLGSLWKKRKVLVVCSVLPLLAAGPQSSQPSAKPGEAKTTEKESLEYSVEWRLVNAGRAKLSIGPAPESERADIEAKLHLESLGLVSRLFHVDDDYTSEMSRAFCAQSTFMVAHEASRNRETKVVYESNEKRAIYREKDLNKNTVISAETAVPPCVHDIIGGLYYLRSLNLEPGKTVQVPVSDGKKSVMLKIECQRREELKTALGAKKTILYEIYAFNNVLYRRPGRLHIWLTDDARKVPVQIQIRMQFTIGTITLRLDKET